MNYCQSNKQNTWLFCARLAFSFICHSLWHTCHFPQYTTHIHMTSNVSTADIRAAFDDVGTEWQWSVYTACKVVLLAISLLPLRFAIPAVLPTHSHVWLFRILCYFLFIFGYIACCCAATLTGTKFDIEGMTSHTTHPHIIHTVSTAKSHVGSKHVLDPLPHAWQRYK